MNEKQANAEPGRGPTPVADYVRVEGTPPNPPTTLTTTAPERDERTDDVANAINAGENRYRQTVLGQSPLLGYPVVEQPPARALDDATLSLRRLQEVNVARCRRWQRTDRLPPAVRSALDAVNAIRAELAALHAELGTLRAARGDVDGGAGDAV